MPEAPYRQNSGVAPRVAVIGAGFGGLNVVRALRGSRFRVELIDRRNHHLFQPLLYQVATAGLEPSDVAYAARGVVRRLPNTVFTSAEVVGADLDRRVLHTAVGAEISYDYLVIAAGAQTSTFGVPGVEEHAFGLKSLADALTFREHLLLQIERCAGRPDLVEAGALTVVVVGGGPTGVEMAGTLGELFTRVVGPDFPEIDISRARVELVEMVDAVLPTYHARQQAHTAQELRRRGVTLRLGRSVKRVGPDVVELDDGTVIRSHNVVWAAGVEPVPLARRLGLAQTRGGRLVVDPDLSVPGRPEVFVVGDLAGATDRKGELLPQLAPVAIQQGKYAADALRRRVAGVDPPAFRFVDKGTMATIGRRSAVAQLPGGLRLNGALAWWAWLVLHIYFLIGFRNRLSVLIDWAWNYLTWDRAARILLGPVPPDRD